MVGGMGVGYKYILDRWEGIVYDLKIHLSPFFHIYTRIWISARVGHTLYMRRYGGHPPIYVRTVRYSMVARHLYRHRTTRGVNEYF